MNYQDTVMLLSCGKNGRKKICNNTYLYPRGEYNALVYHNTEIIKFYPMWVRLYTGSWHTSTTKLRLCKYSPVIVYQKDFDWFIGNWNKPDADDVEFYEGITFDYGGNLLTFS